MPASRRDAGYASSAGRGPRRTEVYPATCAIPTQAIQAYAPFHIVTPHVSTDDGDSCVPLTLELVFRNLERLLEGKRIENVVRPEIEY